MSALTPPKHHSRKHELREDTVITLYARAWQFFDQNRKLVYAALGGVLVLVLLALGYIYYLNQRQARAVELLGGVVQLYEEGQYREALDGAEGKLGLIAIADDYGRTDAGNLARFYAADALFRLGEYDEALRYFRAFKSDRSLIGASAIAGQAAVHETRGELVRAGDLYRRAALHFENEVRSPEYLIRAGRVYEEGGSYEKAEEAYALIQERFPDSNHAESIEFHLARVAARRESV